MPGGWTVLRNRHLIRVRPLLPILLEQIAQCTSRVSRVNIPFFCWKEGAFFTRKHGVSLLQELVPPELPNDFCATDPVATRQPFPEAVGTCVYI